MQISVSRWNLSENIPPTYVCGVWQPWWAS